MPGFNSNAAGVERSTLGKKAGRFSEPSDVRVIGNLSSSEVRTVVIPDPQTECRRTECVKALVKCLEKAATRAAGKATHGNGLFPALVFESLAAPTDVPIRPWQALIGSSFVLDGAPGTVKLISIDEDDVTCHFVDQAGTTGSSKAAVLTLCEADRLPADPILPCADRVIAAGGPVALRKRFRTLVHDARPPHQRVPEGISATTNCVSVETLCEVRSIVAHFHREMTAVAPSGDGDRPGVVRNDPASALCRIIGFGYSHELNVAHLDKLRQLYRGPPAEFESSVFVLLQRYFNLSGADRAESEGGWHGAVPPRVMELMAAELGVIGECFASPLNCVFPRFCSAFEDTDAAFGSQGSFFAWTPNEGCFEVNPPFDHTVAVRTANRMNNLLEAARVADKKLGFVVVLPYSDRGKPLASLDAVVSSMRSGGFVQAEASVPAMECDYVDGMQHCALDTSFVARLDTRIFVLQSPSLATASAAEVGVKAVVDGWTQPTGLGAHEKRSRPEEPGSG